MDKSDLAIDEHPDLRHDDLFPELKPDPEPAARKRLWARHQHNRIVDPDDNERYTRLATFEECRRLANVHAPFGLDVAACPESHWGARWFGRQLDGSFIDAIGSSWAPLSLVDAGPAWCNPPYTELLAFTERIIFALLDGERDTVLYLPPGDRCEQEWWQKWIEPYRDGRGHFRGVKVNTHPLKGRQTFGKPGDPLGLSCVNAPFPNVLVHLWR